MFSDKTFIVHVYALEISCLCPYKESEISENDTSYFRLPQSLQSAGFDLIPRFLKNTFWNCHISCSSKICVTPLIHFLFCIPT